MPFWLGLGGDGHGSPGLSSYLLTRKVVTWWFSQGSTEFLREFWAAEWILSLSARNCGEMALVRWGCQTAVNQRKRVACHQGEVGEFFYRKAAGNAVVAVLSNVSLGCWFWLAEISGLMARRGVDH